MKIQILISITILCIMTDNVAAKSQFPSNSLSALSKAYREMQNTKHDDLKKYTECVEKSQGITLNLMNCSGDEIGVQDGDLNDYYKKLVSELNEEKRMQLRTLQRNWIRNRDKTCSGISNEDGGGGSMSGIIYNDCILMLTVKRKNEIKALIKGL